MLQVEGWWCSRQHSSPQLKIVRELSKTTMTATAVDQQKFIHWALVPWSDEDDERGLTLKI